MTKFDWRKARRRSLDLVDGKSTIEREAELFKQPKPKRKAKPHKPRRHKPAQLHGFRYPAKPATPRADHRPCHQCSFRFEAVIITRGKRPDGTLNVFTFCTPDHARQGGFPYIEG